MTKVLLVTSSLAGAESKSTQLAKEFIAAWRDSGGRFEVAERDLAAPHIVHLSGAHLAAWMTPADKRSEPQQSLAEESDPLVEEVEAADAIVIAAPMYNFSIPSTLKAWIDHITRAGRTFRYTPQGKPEGLLKNKKVFVVAARGGVYTGNSPAASFDFQEPYLRAVLGFIGLTDVAFIHVEGQKVSPAAAEAGVAQARKAIAEIVSAAQAA